MQIYKFETEQEAQQIKDEKASQGMILVAVSNITEGKFLGFMESSEVLTSDPVMEKLTAIETRLKTIEEGQESFRTESLSK